MKTAWFGESTLKDRVMEQLREHRRLDQIVQGKYWESGRGCNLGCLTHVNSDAHDAAERMFGIPQRIGYWLEAVFEGLPQDRCADWVIESADAIPVGADLSIAHHHLAIWLLGPESPSAAGNSHPSVRDVIARVRDLHERAANGETIAKSAARSAESAAESAAWSAAKHNAWIAIAARSLEIFRSCPVAKCDDCESCVQSTMLYLDSVKFGELVAAKGTGNA